MKAILIVLFATWGGAAAAGPADEASHAAGVIAGCRLIAQERVGRTQLDGMQWGSCIGALQMLRAVSNHLQPNMRSCVPPEASTAQAAKVFLKYADQHPELHHLGVEILAVEAFKAAWICKPT